MVRQGQPPSIGYWGGIVSGVFLEWVCGWREGIGFCGVYLHKESLEAKDEGQESTPFD
jgi:hypothetical protein